MADENESNAAKVLRLHGDDRQEELERASEEAEANYKKVSWFENFWYHHKWSVIMFGAFGLIILIAIFQIVDRQKPETIVMYAGPNYVGEMVMNELKPIWTPLLEGSENPDAGEISIYSIVYQKDGPNAAMAMSQFTTEFSAGDCMIYILSPDMYQVALDTNLLVPLNDIFGEKPCSAVDEYGIKLSETPFYQDHAAMMYLGEDAILCVRQVPMLVNVRGKESAQLRQITAREFVKKIVEYLPTETAEP